MNFPAFLKPKKEKTTAITQRTLTDAYQDSLNKLGREQFIKMVSRGIQMPGVAV